MRIEMYRDAAGEHRFRIKGDNGEIIASSEGYKNMRDCLETAHLIAPNEPVKIVAPDDEPEAA